jgi:hypothetical protein
MTVFALPARVLSVISSTKSYGIRVKGATRSLRGVASRQKERRLPVVINRIPYKLLKALERDLGSGQVNQGREQLLESWASNSSSCLCAFLTSELPRISTFSTDLQQ